MYATAIACEIRLTLYMINKRQNDHIIGIYATTKFLEIIGEATATSYIQTAYPLQCDISKEFDLKNEHFYSHPHLLNISLYSSFKNKEQVEMSINAFKADPKVQSLLDFDACLKMLTNNSKSLKITDNKKTGEMILYDKF